MSKNQKAPTREDDNRARKDVRKNARKAKDFLKYNHS